MPNLRRILAVGTLTAALGGAAVYGGLRYANSINNDLAAGPPQPTVTTTAPSAPYGTGDPSHYRYGAPIARAAGGEVIAYTPRHEAQRMLTIPFTITNNGGTAASYQATVTVTVTTGEHAGHADTVTISSEGLLPPKNTMATQARFQSLGAIPSRDLEVRILHVEKKGTA
ncbi:hypothetical protein [Streptomyces lunalinharesii]|uniref:Uncharacterized protein n=1 Tax=Streptomyces lunalinharesii TaxID=333384 RepID=A0ABN3T5Q9_9ACTN